MVTVESPRRNCAPEMAILSRQRLAPDASLLLCRRQFRLPFPPLRCPLGWGRVHLRVICFVAEYLVHGFLQFGRGRDGEPLVGLDEYEFAGRSFEAEEQRAFAGEPGDHIA